ncbi:MAG: hypothetical protein RML12_11185 [Xanthomonadales bacterium]|nr:hypothetical protein [Xanthomonadales bacterium]
MPRRLLVLGLLVLAGCAAERRERELLDETLERYAHAIRWHGFERAAEFLDEEGRRRLALRPLVLERLRQYQVAGYRPRSAALREGRCALQTVEIELVNRHTLAAQTVLDRQEWCLDAAGSAWRLRSALPEPQSGR